MCFYQLHHSINTKLFFQLYFSINPQLFLWPASLHQPIFNFINCISSSIQSFLSTACLRQSTFIFINCNSPSIHSYFFNCISPSVHIYLYDLHLSMNSLLFWSVSSLHQATIIFINYFSLAFHIYYFQLHLSINADTFFNCIFPSIHSYFNNYIFLSIHSYFSTESHHQSTIIFSSLSLQQSNFYQLHLSIYPQLFLSTVCLQQSKFILIFCISLSIHNYIFNCTLYVNPHLFLSIASLDLSAFIFINNISPWIHMSFYQLPVSILAYLLFSTACLHHSIFILFNCISLSIHIYFNKFFRRSFCFLHLFYICASEAVQKYILYYNSIWLHVWLFIFFFFFYSDQNILSVGNLRLLKCWQNDRKRWRKRECKQCKELDLNKIWIRYRSLLYHVATSNMTLAIVRISFDVMRILFFRFDFLTSFSMELSCSQIVKNLHQLFVTIMANYFCLFNPQILSD